MSSRYQRAKTATTLFVIVAVLQTCVGVSFAASTSSVNASSIDAQEVSAILTTGQNKPIRVNGAKAITGATIVSGSLVETPDQVSATINIPGHATLDIAPGTRLIVAFDHDGNPSVTLRQGCMTLHTKNGTSGEIGTSHGVAGKTDRAKDDVLQVCFPRGAAAPTVNAGAGTSPGVGAGGGVGVGAGGGAGLSKGAIAAIVVGGTAAAVGLGLSLRGSNPSPSQP